MKFSEGLGKSFFPTKEKRGFRDPCKKRSVFSKYFHQLLLFFLFLFILVLGFLTNIVVLLKRCFAKPKSLKGRVCFVTGAGRGLGRELCLALAREGAIVACADINAANNQTTAAILKEQGSVAKAYTMNVAVRKDVEYTIGLAEKELGPIYLLVNNAAIVMPILEPTEEFIRAFFNVNTLGYMWTMQAVLPTMISKNQGHIVNMSSTASYVGIPGLSVYSATKAAVTNYGAGMRWQLYVNNPNNKIKITTVHPTIMNSSQDYVESMESRVNFTCEMSDVVADTMTAIKYNKEEISTPGFFRLMLTLFPLVPTWLLAFLNGGIDKVTFPTLEEFQRLPSGDLVNSCSFCDPKEKKSC